MKPANITTKITFILFGVFVASIALSLSLKLFSEIGIWLALILSTILSILGFYYSKKGSMLRLITWGFSGTSASIAITAFVILYMLTKSIETVL
jgi:hypothetical protein